MTGTRRAERVVVAALVIALHAAAGWWLLAPGEAMPRPTPSVSLATFDVPPPEPALPARAAEVLGRSSVRAPARAADPAPLAAPPPVVTVPPPVPLVVAPVAGSGTSAQAGGTAIGNGNGNGAAGTPARLLRGAIRARDYPVAERRARIEGVVTVRFTVTPDGRATACRTMRSSGNGSLDATTCRLIEQRFRYAPARDAGGVPRAEERGWQQRWWIDAPATAPDNDDAPPPGP
ncbi:energy transducer TonB [uncultured Sphingomonas sp.]|uniref:energy transducer TonB n=1 Tax=uncultured Sphingomonas sp. TaxID=158754 RepID=UPI00258433B3|nr:energy transducer TonB [uncultured Sphingomonas sp.]